jgi:hypothetical protein
MVVKFEDMLHVPSPWNLHLYLPMQLLLPLHRFSDELVWSCAGMMLTAKSVELCWNDADSNECGAVLE